MVQNDIYTLGIDIGSTTVKIAVLDQDNEVLFSDYERHFANIQETLSDLLGRAIHKLGAIHVSPVITGSGGLTLAKHLGVPFVQEVIAVSTALQDYAPQTDVAIELGGEDAKIIYFEGGNIEQRMNGVCAGGTGSFIDQMALSSSDRTLPVLTNMQRITKHFTRLLQDVVYLQRRISSHSSMTVLQEKIWLPPFSRQLSTRLSAVLHAVNLFADTLHSLADLCIFSPNCARHLSVH